MAMSVASRSSSEQVVRWAVVRVPAWKASARPVMYSALRWERPAVLSSGMDLVRTCAGVGKEVGLGLVVVSAAGEVGGGGAEEGWNRATNLDLMALAAAPETCWPMMLLTRLTKGSIFSLRPAGDQTLHGLEAMRGAKRGSVEIRWAQAWVRRVPVVEVGFGMESFGGLVEAS